MNELNKEKEQPLVSIITIVYNGDAYIEQCIQSIVNQVYKKIQYIIIDGGSTDNSINIINKYRTHIDVFVTEKDRGISDAFNKGIQKATGDIIGILNSDDIYNEFAVQSVVDAYLANEKKEAVYYGDILYFNDKNSFELIADADRLWRVMSIFHPSTFICKSIYDRLGGYLEEFKYAMDSEFIHRCLFNKIPFIHINKTLANFRLAGTSDRNYKKSHKEFYLSVKKYNYGLYAEWYFYWNVFKKIVLNTTIGQYLNKRRDLLSWLLAGKLKK
ncbi:glycosyltransferase family 2 protein [Mucilaginibacter ginsenosidivorax]|uniref:Glycosyltransferase n=1 Tax=Mucilaginibacter ginsenosidivorax TaxID=862126 RepID=A0A5B8VV80_9SPHI|nr:glycosyltransferase family 2 protein [Mucilaginibacter ginsenosidivorax]QEC74792.1 glycosyltransferase [Mucilaginibacter ginsenosidivorax]